MKVRVCHYTSTEVEVDDSFQKFVCNDEEYDRRWEEGELSQSDVYNLIDAVSKELEKKGIDYGDISAVEDVTTGLLMIEE